MAETKTILYLTKAKNDGLIGQRLLSGVRRLAATHGMAVEVCTGLGVEPKDLPDLLARFRCS